MLEVVYFSMFVDNIVYDNEDSGIDLHGASDILVRGNCSYRNRDHGYDNLSTDRTTFVSNVAARNDHDGMSIEENAFNVRVFNCIFALDAVQPSTLAGPGGVREVFADTTVGFESDWNVIVGLPADDFGTPNFTGYYRRLVELRMPAAPAGRVRYTTLQGYKDSTYALDDHSKVGSAAFVDSAAGVFRPRWASAAVDAADTTAVGWLPTDPSGVPRHDCSGVNNTGNPAGAFGDVGTYEYDDGMTPITVSFGYNTVAVSWTAWGRYGNASWQPVWYEVYVDGMKKAHRDPPAPPAANAWPGYITEIVSASPCQSHDVWVMTRDEYGDTVHATNVVTGTTCCAYPCGIERPGRAAASESNEEADVPLALGWPGANPSHGTSTVTWSIPQAQAGAAYDLSLFDLAGRRIAVVSRGTAKAGKFAQELPFRAGDGALLPNGVFFLRLRVGAEALNRRVVLIR